MLTAENVKRSGQNHKRDYDNSPGRCSKSSVGTWYWEVN